MPRWTGVLSCHNYKNRSQGSAHKTASFIYTDLWMNYKCRLHLGRWLTVLNSIALVVNLLFLQFSNSLPIWRYRHTAIPKVSNCTHDTTIANALLYRLKSKKKTKQMYIFYFIFLQKSWTSPLTIVRFKKWVGGKKINHRHSGDSAFDFYSLQQYCLS